ncbi:SPOR domain-containing protein [Vibrio sp. 10N.261.55.A7]|uniref:SPOR domain-containing protein n=1 Tax=Vibrio sp. 10N.261.55.A7 TaxID=1880851 RepID=UPI000C818F0A|nr:SPOR domain-containing protein [Vibrio sp. 10N.261.55.A7]PMJ99147.1 sporulation protein [Vibrio sp. 10N.261.55.A7]
MDTKLVIRPRMIGIKLLSITAMAFPLLFQSASADEFLCDATQASTNELPVLDTSCPIGKGLWGNQKPRGEQSSFWIQCGVLSKPLSLAKAKSIYQHISTDVWSKPESSGYRCLIGPYDDFARARKELAAVKTEPVYKESFIREVVKGAKPEVSQASPKKPSTSKPAMAKPVAKESMAVVAPALLAPPVEAPASEEEKVVVRLKATIEGLEYRLPYSNLNDSQFYMEHGLPWNRVSYESATDICHSMGMRLPVENEWTKLLESNVMKGDNWPMHLPYWGFERKGMFTSGKISQLKGTSLLNVLCVK